MLKFDPAAPAEQYNRNGYYEAHGQVTAAGQLGELATQASRHLAVRNVFVAANGSSTL